MVIIAIREYRGVVVKHVDSEHRECQFDSSTCHIQNAIGEEGNWKPPHEIHFPRKELKSPVAGFCYARNRVCNAAVNVNTKERSLDCLCFLLYLTSSAIQFTFKSISSLQSKPLSTYFGGENLPPIFVCSGSSMSCMIDIALVAQARSPISIMVQCEHLMQHAHSSENSENSSLAFIQTHGT